MSLIEVSISWGYCEGCAGNICPLELQCWSFTTVQHAWFGRLEGQGVEEVGEKGEGAKLWVFVISTALPLLLRSLFFVVGTSSSGFGNLVTIGVSFLVWSGSDPHFNPYLAITEMNWLGSLSNTEYVFVLLPAWNSLLIHFFTTFQFISLSRPLIKARRSVVFSCFIRENTRIAGFCSLNLVDGCQQLGKRLNFSPEFQP